MPRPLFAEIRPDALAANLAQVRRSAPAARIWAVVKAHAYGHGLEAALGGLSGADGLALVEFDAAAQLRDKGYAGPVLMLEGAFAPPDVAQAREQGLSLVVHAEHQLQWLESESPAQASRSAAEPVSIWLKLNTGMHRLGLEPCALPGIIDRLLTLQGSGRIALAGWMTHFANADLPGGAQAAWQQFETLRAALAPAQSWPVSVSNSAAIIARVAEASDWVRPGIMLYGASPFADRDAASLGLKAAMRLHSQIIAVRELAAGDAVGYGSTFVAPCAMRLGVVACGYADGYPRHAPTGTPVAIEGVRSRLVGRVSMDMLTVDLTPVPQAGCGSSVELWGDGVSVDEVARAAGTIGYELLCAVAPRVPRRLV
jgi:alanine racemase